ncbi:prolactin-2B1-like [Acomys russatus]|uniref:prolactin-2B1-like n=1 Tax=Acomys russatus TaxID=60746 RepID=UPI0021E23E2D|nr:prolactin-2B1-like [Acomys russatus]
MDKATEMYMEKLLQKTTYLSHILTSQVGELFRRFDQQYVQSMGVSDIVPDFCHTEAFDTPETKEETLETNPKELLNLAYSILGSYNDTLHHLVDEMSIMQGNTSALLIKARQIQQKFIDLMYGVKLMLIVMEEQNNAFFAPWSGESSLQLHNADERTLYIYNLIRCVFRDVRKISTFIEIVKYQMTNQMNC